MENEIEDKKKMKNILTLCMNSTFIVKKIITKKEKKSPPPPFTTSSLQQEAYNKLNYSISKTMFLAQKLYEKGFITYIRTDSTSLSKTILSEIKDFILFSYGIKYLSLKEFSKYKKENKPFQEAHESIHPTVINFNKNYLDSLDIFQKRLYKLIWKRTIMGQMTDTMIEKKNIYIKPSQLKNFFIYTKKTVLFDGFMKIINQDKNEKIDTFLIKKDFLLDKKEIIAQQIVKNHLYRYNEGSLVKKLEKLGIGRPSTYVPIISTIQKRNYVHIQKISKKTENREIFILKGNSIIKKNDNFTKIEKNKFFPTEIGVLTTNFLNQNFYEIVNYTFTANLEKNFDDIAQGRQSWIEVVKNFYGEFYKKIQYVKKHVDKIRKERFLGTDPKSNQKVFSKIAKYGPVVQMGEFNSLKKPKFSPLLINKQKIETISLTEALKLLELPKSLGIFDGKEILLKINKYNIYIKYNNQSIPIDEKIFLNNFLNLEEAINIIIENKNK